MSWATACQGRTRGPGMSAAAAGRTLRGVAVDRVITSGMRRAEGTARIVPAQSGAAHPEPEAWPDLREFRPGSPDSVPDDASYESSTLAFRGPEQPDPDASYPGGETIVSREPVGRGAHLGHLEQTTCCVDVLAHDPVPTVEQLVIEYRDLRARRAAAQPNGIT